MRAPILQKLLGPLKNCNLFADSKRRKSSKNIRRLFGRSCEDLRNANTINPQTLHAYCRVSWSSSARDTAALTGRPHRAVKSTRGPARRGRGRKEGAGTRKGPGSPGTLFLYYCTLNTCKSSVNIFARFGKGLRNVRRKGVDFRSIFSTPNANAKYAKIY